MDKLKLTAAALIIAAALPALAEDAPAQAQAQGAAAASQAPAGDAQQDGAQQDGPQPDENGYYQGAGIYVSDNVNALLRSGPANGYRTTGVLHPGDQVTFSRYSPDKRFIEVVTQDGRKVWMRFADLQPTPAARNQLEQLKAEVEELKHELEQAQQQPAAREAAPVAEGGEASQGSADASLSEEISSLKAENERLRKAIEDGASSQGAAAAQPAAGDTRRELDLQMRWWLQGALIALGGAVAGIILVMLPKPRRKRRERF